MVACLTYTCVVLGRRVRRRDTCERPGLSVLHVAAGLLTAGLLVLGGLATSAVAQPSPGSASSDAPRTVAPGQPTNLFATFDVQTAADGLLVELPSGWRLKQATLLRYGTRPEAVTISRDDRRAGAVRLAAEQPLRGPYDLVLRVQPGGTSGMMEWSVVPYGYQASERVVQNQHRLTRRVQVRRALAGAQPESGAPDASAPSNYALSFAARPGPLVLAPQATPPLGRPGQAFTAAFWMRTLALDEVVVSAWTGQEAEPYPLELVVDPSGRLRYYLGDGRSHRTLMTTAPVADGAWHYVAVTYAPERRVVTLALDGAAVDSLTGVTMTAPPGPARLAVGGRLPASGGRSDSAGAALGYSGALDELRVVPQAASPRSLRRMMRQPVADASPASGAAAPNRRSGNASAQAGPRDAAAGETGLALGFDTEVLPAGKVATRPEDLQRTASTLSFQPALQALQATLEEESVRLAWNAPSSDNVEAFFIERSTDGRQFETVARLSPEQARRDGGAETSDAQYAFVDEEPDAQVLFYRVRQVFATGGERASGVLKVGLGPQEMREATLVGNFPNPFQSTTTIAYEVRRAQEVSVSVWNVSGNRIRQLADRVHQPGYYELSFSADELSSGTYFVRLRTPSGTDSHRMVLLK